MNGKLLNKIKKQVNQLCKPPIRSKPMKVSECILAGVILGIIFTVAICMSGYENEVREARVAGWQMEISKYGGTR